MSDQRAFRVVPTKRGKKFTLHEELPKPGPTIMYPEFDTPENVIAYIKKEFPGAQIID